MMKTRTKLLLPLMLLCIAVSTLTLTAAAAEPTLTLSASSGAARGETLEVQLLLTGNPGIWGPLVRVSYDADQLELLSAVNGEIYTDSELMANVGRNPVIINFNQQSLKNNYKNGKLATLKFLVKETATANVTTIGISSYEIINEDENNVTFRTVDAAVTICSMHSFGEWQTVREATEAEDGERIRTCRNCGYVEREAISVPKTGTCGDNLTYTLDTNTGVLTISGTGKMENWNSESAVPWYSRRSSIRTVQISKAVASIGAYAFRGCSNLTSITIPNRVTSIGAYAFYGCSSLASIVIPSSVTSIGAYAFYGCSGLNAVYITDLTAWCRVSFGNIGANPLIYAHNLYLNDDLVTNLVIPESVTDIGSVAFKGCSSLTSITIPESVTSIGSDAFNGCSSLNAVYITDLAAWYRILFGNKGANPLYSAHNLYLNGDLVTNLVISESVTDIGNCAFSGCSGLTSITIPESVTSIGGGAFSGCSGLTSITIPESVTSIGGGAFSGCSGLARITIPDSVTSIGDGAFSGCSGLTSFTIPDSVTSIGASAFSDCSGLASVSIPDSVTSIGRGAFSDCSGLTSVTIPDSVTSIGAYAFSDCSGLTSITIPDSVTIIGSGTFHGCSNLASITIPFIGASSDAKNGYNQLFGYIFGYAQSNRPPYSGFYYFDGHYYYYYIYIPSTLHSVTVTSTATIPHNAFNGCSSLMSITIPDSVASIGSDAFYGCSSLTSITILSPDCQIDDSQTTIPSTATIYGYTGSTAAAYAEKYGRIFVSIGETCGKKLTFRMDYDTGILSITGTGAMDSWYFDDSPWYAYRTSIRSIQIARGATSIGDFAFDGCSNLVDIMIAETVESIGDGAFDNCTSLAEVTILNDTCKIPDRADAFPASVTIHGNAGSTAEAYAKKYNRAFVQIGHTHVYAEDYTVDVPAGCTTAGAKSRHCAVEGCTETIDSTVIPAVGHKFGAWTIIREATLDNTGERTHTCEVCGTSATETMPKRVRGDADGDGAVTIRDALLTLRAVLDGAAMNPYMDANGDGKLMLTDVLLILHLAAA